MSAKGTRQSKQNPHGTLPNFSEFMYYDCTTCLVLSLSCGWLSILSLVKGSARDPVPAKVNLDVVSAA